MCKGKGMELFQAEWCPHSHAVRQRLTELGLDFVARQVPADPGDRDGLERVAGTNEIPVLVADDGSVYRGDDEILEFLDEFDERPDAGDHREKAAEEVPEFAEMKEA
jgi:glutathione S-transferase